MIVRWLGALGLAVSLSACTLSSTPGPTNEGSGKPRLVAPDPSAAVPPSSGTALTTLGTLAVKGRAPRTGYDRDLYGQAWVDVDRNGCDTRNDILARDLTGETFRPGTRDCVVITGTLLDPYTGQSIAFTKDDAGAVQIDHVVALSDAWQKGAQQWPAEKRLSFANDPLNLLAVDGTVNAAKSDGDAATWLPPNREYRCALVARQTAVKARYSLWVTAAERDAIARVLSQCPAEPLPAGGSPEGAAVTAPALAMPSREPSASSSQNSGIDVNHGTCRNARANGAGPYYRGSDPEYGFYRDGDGDGIVCE